MARKLTNCPGFCRGVPTLLRRLAPSPPIPILSDDEERDTEPLGGVCGIGLMRLAAEKTTVTGCLNVGQYSNSPGFLLSGQNGKILIFQTNVIQESYADTHILDTVTDKVKPIK